MEATIDTSLTSTSFPQSEPAIQPARRVRFGGAFGALFVVEALVIAAVCAVVIVMLKPGAVPLANTPDYMQVRDAVRARLNGTTPDPFIEVAPGVTARSSNLRGFTLNGYTYYYQFAGERGFDPLSRGAVSPNDVETVLTDTSGPAKLIIYRVVRNTTQ